MGSVRRHRPAPRPPPNGLTARGSRAAESVPGSPKLYDYGVIGNLRTAALVSRTGSIDWACFPEFHSPSTFGRILDAERGGFCSVAPTQWREAVQRYLPGTNILRTHFVVDAVRSLSLTDFLPVTPSYLSEHDTLIFRRIEADGGPVEVAIEVDPRFDYGRAPPTSPVRTEGGTLVWDQGDSHLAAKGPWAWERAGRRSRAVGVLESGEPAYFSLDWGERAAAQDPEVLLNATQRFWRDWVQHPDAPMLRTTHVWRDWVERSELLLKLLSRRETGSFVAAPTTSLPEWPGGPRNWDYRYAWPRDAAFAVQALLALGHTQEARAYVRWIVRRVAAAGTKGLQTMYTVSGDPVPREEELPRWRGMDGSRPVRIGNAANRQVQLDIYGEVMDAVEQLWTIDPALLTESWPVLSRLVDAAARSWQEPDAGIWESRDPPAHYVHSKVMCWVALDRGRRLAERLGHARIGARWAGIAARIHRTVIEKGYDVALGSFVQAFDRRQLDASALRIPMTGFLPFDDPHVRSTIEAIEMGLARGPFVYRYKGEGSRHGPEGSFLLCSFWLVECLARSGERERAVGNFRRLLRAAGPLKLFSEEFDPLSGRALGNFPQAFTHIGVLRAALAIGGPL